MGSKNRKNKGTSDSSTDMQVGDWDAGARVRRERFPASGPCDVRLRIAMKREALAEVTAHAKEVLDKEICGVLVGYICEDDDGRYPSVQAAVRGSATGHGSQHVTYTQETWTEIHKTIDEKYPKMSIVGWYHSHPGFGVQFSDMDKFIQTNFFGAPTQFGLVTDPLGGDTAILVNGPDCVENVGRCWVDGREQKCWMPLKPAESAANSVETSSPDMAEIDRRLVQLVQTLDETRDTVHKIVMFGAMVICAAVVLWIAAGIWRATRPPLPPSEQIATVPVPIEVDGKEVILQVRVSDWKIPKELDLRGSMEDQYQLERDRAVREAVVNAKLLFDCALAKASPAELEQLVADAKKRVDAMEESAHPKETAKASPWKQRTQIFLLWGVIGAIVLGIGAFIVSSLRSEKRR